MIDILLRRDRVTQAAVSEYAKIVHASSGGVFELMLNDLIKLVEAEMLNLPPNSPELSANYSELSQLRGVLRSLFNLQHIGE